MENLRGLRPGQNPSSLHVGTGNYDGISLPAFSLDNFVYRDNQIAKVLDIYAYFATCCKRGGADLIRIPRVSV